MFTVNEVLNKHYPQVANNPILFKSLSFVLRHLLHEREITEFGETYPHYEDIDFVRFSSTLISAIRLATWKKNGFRVKGAWLLLLITR